MAAPADLFAAIEGWVASGIITAAQATLIRADLSRALSEPTGGLPLTAPRPSKAALVTEALGYLGGVIILVAMGLVTGSVWDQLPLGVRLSVFGVLTVLLVVAGALIPSRLGASGARLRSVLWLASSAALAALLGLGTSELASWTGETEVMVTALGTAIYSAVLWRAHHHGFQQVAVFVPLLVAVGVGVSLLPDTDSGALSGLAVWGVSAVWLVLAWGGVLPGRQLGTLLGGFGMVIGAAVVGNDGWGLVLSLATVTALIAMALIFRDLFLLAVGAVGTLIVVPSIMSVYFPGALGPALVLLGLGVLLVAAAVLMTRRRADAGPGEEPRWATGSTRFAMPAALAIVVATSVVVLVAGVS